LDSGSLDFIDVLGEVQPPVSKVDASPTPAFQAILKRVQDVLDREKPDGAGPTMVILDDITMLEWIGFPLLGITRFARALRAACMKVRLRDSTTRRLRKYSFVGCKCIF